MMNEKDEWGNIPLPGVDDDTLFTKKWNQSYALKGRKRTDQSEFMIENNPMKGKVSANRGKSMPQISEKIKGKPKHTLESKAKISAARKGNIPWSKGKKQQ